MSEIAPRPITEARFRFNMEPQEALDLLTAAYRAEVARRNRDFVLDENTEHNLVTLARYLTQEAPKFGIMCCGICGNGKTTLLYAFQRAVNYLEGKRHFSFLDDDYRRFRGAIRIFDAKEIAQIARDYKKFGDVKALPMLAIDDMGKEPAEILDYGTAISPVVDLIEYRYNKQLFTFITTNLAAKGKNPDDPGTIRKKYGDRIADRFNEMLHTIVFKDISYRTNAK